MDGGGNSLVIIEQQPHPVVNVLQVPGFFQNNMRKVPNTGIPIDSMSTITYQ
jgi:hypothetical protein